MRTLPSCPRIALAVALATAFAGAQDGPATTAAALEKEIARLRCAGQFDDAVGKARELVAHREAAVGAEHRQTRQAAESLATLRRAAALPADAQARLAEAHRKIDDASTAPAFKPELLTACAAAVATLSELLGPEAGVTLRARYLDVTLRGIARDPTAEQAMRELLPPLTDLLGDHEFVADLWNGLGVQSMERHAYRESYACLARSAAIAKSIGNQRRQLQADLNLGALALVEGDLVLAESVLRQQLTALEDGKNEDIRASALNLYAQVLWSRGDPGAALGHAREAVRLAEKEHGPEHPDTAAALLSLAGVHMRLGQYDAAATLFQDIVARWRRLGKDAIGVRANHANAIAKQGRREEAIALYRAILGPGRELPRHLARTARALANVLLAQGGDLAEAESLLQRALAVELATEAGVDLTASDRAEAAATLTLLGEAQRAQGKAEEARQSWARAATFLVESRQRAASEALLGTFMNAEHDPVTPLVADAASRGAAAEAWSWLEADRARGLLDSIAARAGSKGGRDVVPLAEVQAALPDDTALVTWVDTRAVFGLPDRDRNWGCVVRHTGDPIWVRLRGSAEGGAFTPEQAALGTRAAKELAEATGSSALAELKAIYLDPLLPHLAGVRHVIHVPTTGVPVEALTDQFVVTYAPSASVLATLLARPRAADRPARALVLGDPAHADAALPPLPDAAAEATAVAALFAERTLLTGSKASERALHDLAVAARAGLASFPVLHLACHGRLDELALMATSIELTPSPRTPGAATLLDDGTLDDGHLTAAEMLRTWRLDADLVVLSACHSAAGRTAGNRGPIGMAHALLAAGARSTITARWAVESRATALLMTRFYENWLGRGGDARAGQPAGKPMAKAAALAGAQRWLAGLTHDEVTAACRRIGLPLDAVAARGDDPVRARRPPQQTERPYAHPGHWAAFVLVGDPR